MHTAEVSQRKPINILDLRDSPWVDGPGRTILDCAESIENETFHFVIGSFSGGSQKTNAYAEEASKRGLQVISIPERKSFDWKVISFILKIIDEYNINIIHTHDFRSNVFGLFCAKMRGIPVVSTVHGWIANDLKGKAYCYIDKLLLRFFNHIISVSDRTKTLINKSYISDSKITVIKNALTIKDYLIDRSNIEFRKEIGAEENTILVANIGRLSPEKGQREFLEAALEILKVTTNIKFIMIGIGPEDSSLRKFVSDFNMNNHVVFAGYRGDMKKIYNNLDLVVQSSYTEGMPNVVLEALLLEVPVIATDVGGTGEIIRHEFNGVLIKPGSISNLVNALKDYFEHSEKYRAMAKEGRKTILEFFDHDKRAKSLAHLYKKLMMSRI